MSLLIQHFLSKINILKHFIKKEFNLYKNIWGILIVADLDCTSSETLFDKEIKKLINDLSSPGRDYYITLIINGQYGFLKKLFTESEHTIADEEIKTLIFQNTDVPKLIQFQEISEQETLRALITTYHTKKANSKFHGMFTWGHGLAYSIFKKNIADDTIIAESDKINIKKHFTLVNESSITDLLLPKTVSRFIDLEIKANFSSTDIIPSVEESKNYLNMSELSGAVLGAYGREIDLLILSNCGMAYSRTGMALSKATNFWLAGETFVNAFDIIPANLLGSLKNSEIKFSTVEFAKSLYPESSEFKNFKLFNMKKFKKFNELLASFSKALYYTKGDSKELIIKARNNCSPLVTTPRFHLISFFDFCGVISKIDSERFTFVKNLALELLSLKNELIITFTKDNFGLSIFFPATIEDLKNLEIDIEAKEILGDDAEIPENFRKYMWEYFVLKLLMYNSKKS